MPWAIAASAVIGAIASNSAANKQADAANRATDQQTSMYGQNRADLAPWRTTGQAGLSRLAQLLGIDTSHSVTDPSAPGRSIFQRGQAQPTSHQEMDPRSADFGSLSRNFGLSDFQADPGYQFRLDQGQQGIQNTAAARGSLMSGATLKALDRFNQDTASNEYGNAYQRFTNDQSNQFNRLSALAGMGQNAAAQTGSMGTQVGNSIAQNTMGAGNALAGGTVGGANAINSGLGTYLNYQNSQALLNRLGPTTSSYGGGNGSFSPQPMNYSLSSGSNNWLQ